MNLGYLCGYAERFKIIGTQTIPINGYNTLASSGGCLVAPMEATHVWISALAQHQNPITDGSTYYRAVSGAGACYRVLFSLSPTQRYIPIISASNGIYIGSDGSANKDLNSSYGPRYETLPYMYIGAGYNLGNNGPLIWIHRISNQSTATISLPTGQKNAGAKGGDGRVITLLDGGILATGAGSDDSGDFSATMYGGGAVPAPWRTQEGGRTDNSTPGDGASLYRSGNTYNNVDTGTRSRPGAIANDYENGWVVGEFLATLDES